MADRFILSHISRIPSFQHLPPDQLDLIGSAFEVRRYNPGEYVFRQGEPTSGMYKIVAGQGMLIQTDANGRQQQVGVVGEDDLLKENMLYAQEVNTASLFIQQQSVILHLPRQRLMALVAHHPALKTSLGLEKRTDHHVHDVHFHGQREDEEVLLLTRRHWWAWVRRSWIPVMLMIALWILALLIPVDALRALLFVVSIVFPGVLVIYMFLEWRNDSVIITDQRIIRIIRTILTFNTSISEIAIESVHEANSEVPSYDFFARLFNYGTVQLKTAGSVGNLEFDFMPDPLGLQQLIIEDSQMYNERQAQKQRHTIRAELDQWISGGGPGQTGSQKPKQGQQPATSMGKGPLQTVIQMNNGDTIYRKHLAVWGQHVALPSMLLLVSAIAFVVTLVLGLGLVSLAVLFAFLVGVVWFYFADWDWRNDYLVVSDTTITIIHRRPLWLQNEMDQILMHRIDNVVSTTSGFLANLFGYGEIKVSLLGADQHKVFAGVPRPREIQADISRRQARSKQHEYEESARQQRESIGEYLTLYHEMQNQGNQSPGTTPQPISPGVIQPSVPQNVPTRAASIRDRVRPPGTPRQRLSSSSPGPSMSSGQPYAPPTTSRPRRIPRSRPPRRT